MDDREYQRPDGFRSEFAENERIPREPRLWRVVARAIRLYEAKLRLAADSYFHGANHVGDDGGRAGAFHALTATIEFLQLLKFPQQEIQPLLGLAAAMSDLDKGAEHPMLKLRRRKGHPPEREQAAAFRLACSLIMQMHMDAGMSKDEAAAASAREIGRMGYKIKGNSRSKSEATTIANWRESISTGVSGDQLYRRYHDTIGRVAELNLSKQEAIEHFVRGLEMNIPTQL